MTVGQEFHAFAAALEAEIGVLREAEKHLYTVTWAPPQLGQRSTCRKDNREDRPLIWQVDG
jgi:aspartate ammonia-lyase